ncbi:tautomerase family protein [Dyella silvatica]|uniref:tautomerase family protein n=1 Tax=Dyella silvatica TaxID=2992128 RepID=UPI002256036C|nr:hypothetical protein [Dyella silvatica]
MPISVHVTEGLLSTSGKREVLPRLADAVLRAHGLTGNAFMAPNVIGHLLVSAESESYVGGKAQSLAVIEVKVPMLTFANTQIKQAFVTAATDLIDELKAGSHPRERTFVNVTYAVDGSWGIGGKAYSNDELGTAIQQAATD